MKMERNLASIQIIRDLQPIEGADRIMLASVLGWKCVVDKGQFNVGDKCIYFEIDSLIPAAPWNDRFRKEAMDKPLRIKTRKFKGQISQGLCFDLSIIPFECTYTTTDAEGEPELQRGEYVYEVGDDVTTILKVEKWELPVPAELSGQIKGNFPTVYISKTDEIRVESIQNIVDECIDKNLEMVGTLKCDGSSMTTGIIPYPNHELGKMDREFIVCSRNLNLKESEGNSFWKMVRKYDIGNKLLPMAEDFCLQMEIIGEGIQKNRMGIKGIDVRVFNVKNITQGVYLGHDAAVEFCSNIGIPFVPVIVRRKFTKDDTADSLLKIADELKYDNGHPAEGIVWRPIIETYSDVLKGRLSFKTVSRKFLLHIGE